MLKLAVISDLHLGFSWGTERGQDAFEAASQAFELAIKQEPDMILLLGDIFHDKIPKPEVLAAVIELLAGVRPKLKSEVKIIKRIKEQQEEELKQKIPSIICIYGTHERRHSQSINPVQILEKAGFLYCLHAESILVESGINRLGIHGLSGVPESYAKTCLKSWDPSPFPDVSNVLMTHQSYRDLIPAVKEDILEFSDLPAGFDLFLLGHIHWNSSASHPVDQKPILIPGSTVCTQLTKVESEKEKGFYIINLGREKGDIKFIPIKSRPFFYESVNVENKTPAEILTLASDIISKHLIEGQKPIIRIKLEGTLAKGFSPADLSFNELLREFKEKAILSISKSDLTSKELSARSSLLAELKEKKQSVDEIGINLLAQALGIDARKVESLFTLLAEDDLVKAELELNTK